MINTIGFVMTSLFSEKKLVQEHLIFKNTIEMQACFRTIFKIRLFIIAFKFKYAHFSTLLFNSSILPYTVISVSGVHLVGTKETKYVLL